MATRGKKPDSWLGLRRYGELFIAIGRHMFSQEDDGVSGGVGDLLEEEAADDVQNTCGLRGSRKSSLVGF